MAVIVGIDEAGLGPVLGPLVVSASAFRLPAEYMDLSMWRLLAGAVGTKASRRKGAIAIADSKMLFSRSRKNPLEHLERGVLAMLAAAGQQPRSLRQLLAVLAPAGREQMTGYPWYTGDDLPLPHCITRTDVTLAGNALQTCMAGANIALMSLRAELVFVGEFNRNVRATRNKSTTLFDVTCRLLMRLWESLPPGEVRIHVDRQGGRIRYLSALQRVFGGCKFKVIGESDSCSAYRISDGRRDLEVHFATRSEQRHLPVALASMVSKYLRELFMARFNEFWSREVPGIRPTAGYYTDGRRFYADIMPAVRRLDVDENLLYRSR